MEKEREWKMEEEGGGNIRKERSGGRVGKEEDGVEWREVEIRK
jgi:hypothetical protein